MKNPIHKLMIRRLRFRMEGRKRLKESIAMADIRGFRAFRYDLGQVGSLSDVVAPPYDVVDPALQQRLYDLSPYNAIRLELTKDEPGDTGTDDRYARAAQALRDWIAANVLRQ